MAVVGILALQGAIEPHIKMLEGLGTTCLKITTPQQLENIERLLMPGGESSTMLKLLDKTGLSKAITEFSKTRTVWGICAGAILIAKEVLHPKQNSLGLINIRAHRNHYGSQLESFKTKLNISSLGIEIEADFIRAPLLEPLDKSVQVLATHNQTAVLLKKDNIIASSFHTELGTNNKLHQWFLNV